MGFGFRCGFLGMLHMEIVQERLEREYDLNLITTAPTVVYEVLKTDGTVMPLDNPAKLPPVNTIEEIREPIIRANILTPPDYVGNVITLCEEKRGAQVGITLPGQPGADQLRAADGRSGAGLLRPAEVGVARLRLAGLPLRALRGRPVRARGHADQRRQGRRAVASSCTARTPTAAAASCARRCSELIPRQMFDVAIQAAVGAQIIARSTVKAMRKNVLAKCYGGDVTRKKKLLEKQKEGKKRMKQVGTRGDPAGSLPRRAAGRQQVSWPHPARTGTRSCAWMLDFETILVVLTAAHRHRLAGGQAVLRQAPQPSAPACSTRQEPVLVDYSRAFFPVLAIVLVLRSFVAEPFRIPSSSMMPTLLIGDFILVNKFAYGLRLPINNKKFVAIGEPERGDVVVFRPPHHPDQDWIKRVIGLPGDTIAYRDNTVFVNGVPLKYQQIGELCRQGAGRGHDRRRPAAGRPAQSSAPRPGTRATLPFFDPGRRGMGGAGRALFRDGRQS